MQTQDQLSSILVNEQEGELIPFLRSLDAKQRKELVSYTKKLNKAYLDYTPVTVGSTTTYKSIATPLQRKMLGIASFVLYNLSEFEKSWAGSLVMEREVLAQILPWYCPPWFNDFMNKYGAADYIPYFISYEWVMELTEQGYVSPGKSLLVKLLPQAIFEHTNNVWSYRPEKLLNREITLREHIWYVFELESPINWSDRYLSFSKESASEKTGWIEAYVSLSNSGKINRERLLKEALAATNRNFNKTLSGWFVDLFTRLQPTKEEILTLQKELMQVFNAPHSKVVNMALKYFKTLTAAEAFQLEEFLNNTPLLLASDTKAVVTSTLMVLDTLARKHRDKVYTISLLACAALLHPDDSLQSRAAKLVLKHGSSSDPALREAVAIYYDTLFVHARNLLQDFVIPSALPEATLQETSEDLPDNTIVHAENKIEPVRTYDELVYLASQALDNNQPYHLDLLAAALIDLQQEIRGENISKLEPAFQRAYKLLLGEWQSNTGYLDHMLATFLVNYASFLVQTYPTETQPLEALHSKYRKQDLESKDRWSDYTLRLFSLEDWKTHNKNRVYEPHKHVLLKALAKLQQGDRLPLLSTPTHVPGWISPVDLVKRLEEYTSAGAKPDSMDLQMALSRCVPETTPEALSAATKLGGEYGRLMLFLMEPDSQPEGPFSTPVAWLAAALARTPKQEYQAFKVFPYEHLPHHYLTGQFGWQALAEAYTYNRYDYATRKQVQVHDTRKVLRVFLEMRVKPQTDLKAKMGKLLPFRKKQEPLLYEYLTLKATHLEAEHRDIQRLLLLVPNNPELLLAQVISQSLTHPTFWSEADRKMVTATISALHDLWQPCGTTAHLFVATCMLSSDKTIRAFAAELWVKAVSNESINSALLGEILGLQEQIEFAPLKRLTDLLIGNLLQLSSRHNAQLEILLIALLQQLPEEPIKNLKKLLEVYLEILSLNGSVAAESLVPKLEVWKNVSSLQKTVDRIKMQSPIEATPVSEV